MTKEEAIEIIWCCLNDGSVDRESLLDAFRMARQALEKQIQIKPRGDSLFKGTCPSCRKFVSIGDDYCSKCGQALRREMKKD